MKRLEHPWTRLLLALVIGATLTVAPRANAEELAGACLLDEQGRQLIPGGYVVLENVHYTPDDYRRMVRMGANFQVIRTPLGQIGGWPGVTPNPDRLQQFDDMVRMGRDAGLRTVFKLVVYAWDSLPPRSPGMTHGAFCLRDENDFLIT